MSRRVTDRPVRFVGNEKIQQAIAHAEVIEEAGHFMWYEQPAEFYQIIQQFWPR